MIAQFAAPVIIDDLAKPTQIRRLLRMRRSGQSGVGPEFLETFLQQLIDTAPSILPVEEIEPSFRALRSVCTELPLGRGEIKYLDNLLINADGRICLVECKLWRNPEAIRSVAAQILDYAGELASLSYEDLRSAVHKALRESGGDPLADRVLGPDAGPDETIAFIDSVTRSLQLGNFLLLIVGDGIRSGLQQIAGLLQNRATLGFSLALIEMTIYGNDEGQGPFYVQPRRLLSTEVITRNVFVTGPVIDPQITVTAGNRPQSISEQEFWDALKSVDAPSEPRLRAFLEKCQELGCAPELKRGYNLYVDDPNGARLNLATVTKDSQVNVWGASARDKEYQQPVGHDYMERLASLIPGVTVKNDFENKASWHLQFQGKASIPVKILLDYQDGWLAAITEVVAKFREIENRRD